ncbi:phenylalanine--tRNA ligase subunit alpha [Longirhabdus pacifica]|uniref:phenylalanine--tRNA ligase subunit alpha n=1 Tax=Longirhabdus pacifica TaxID=2305227 RepID=UPI0010087D00|nr:phenylalanine--tRNA ligase subunit alpha [Longirhabdus pacifica]
MKDKLLSLQQEALDTLHQSTSLSELNDLRIKYLGKKGPITEVLRGMGSLSAEERPIIGQVANEVRAAISEAIQQKQEKLEKEETDRKLQVEKIDVTLPGRPSEKGSIHPLTKIIQEMEDIFLGMGFQVAEGPEVETDYYNFEALNIHKNHPARDMQDTFYITDDLLLRTHTSSVQIRTMQNMKGEVPVKIICPGRVYRRDDDDATHSHMFTQIEGLVIDKHIRMSDLKGTLLQFVKEMFGNDTEIRLRPSFFPFTEPSAEVDVSCTVCKGKGCRVCKQTGWIEILGSGMVHPKVLEMSGYDPKEYSGFAFGTGVERIAMLKYGIEDIRHFFTNDLRFLKQFAHI